MFENFVKNPNKIFKTHTKKYFEKEMKCILWEDEIPADKNVNSAEGKFNITFHYSLAYIYTFYSIFRRYLF